MHVKNGESVKANGGRLACLERRDIIDSREVVPDFIFPVWTKGRAESHVSVEVAATSGC